MYVKRQNLWRRSLEAAAEQVAIVHRYGGGASDNIADKELCACIVPKHRRARSYVHQRYTISVIDVNYLVFLFRRLAQRQPKRQQRRHRQRRKKPRLLHRRSCQHPSSSSRRMQPRRKRARRIRKRRRHGRNLLRPPRTSATCVPGFQPLSCCIT